MQRLRPVSIRTAVTLLVGAYTLLGVVQAYAGALEAAKERGTLVVGVRQDFPPLGYLDANGKHAGFEVELARYMARQLLGDESKLQVKPISAGSRITALLSGSADMLIAAMTATEDRASVLAFSDPYFISGSLLLVPGSSSIHAPQDATGKKVAVIEGSIQEEGLAQAAPGATRVKFWRIAEAVEALRAGRVDALAEDDILVLALARQNPDLTAVGTPFRPRPYAVAMPKDDRNLVAWVNDQLRKAKADGTYDTLWHRYFSEGGGTLLRP